MFPDLEFIKTALNGLRSRIENVILQVRNVKTSVNTMQTSVNAMQNSVKTKMDKHNPTGAGSFSLNRKADTTVGYNSFAEGTNTTASGDGSHAEGVVTIASGNNSHAEGCGTHAASQRQHVQGQYNIEDTDNTYADIIGNGTYSSRSNAATVDWSGNAWYAGDVFVGGASQKDGVKLLKTGEAIPIPQTASVGQAIVVKAVDENGKPTEWEAADMASGDGKSAYEYAQEGGYTGTEEEFSAKLAEEIPDALPNPHPLTFTGAVTGSYDGSETVTVDIPSGGADAGYKDSATLLDVTLDDETGGLTSYEYDVSGIEKTDVIIINILFPESYTGTISIRNQDNKKIADEFPGGAKGIVVGIKAMNGRYLHSAVSTANIASRVDMPLSLFYGQVSGASGFERLQAQDTITKIKFTLTSAFASGTQIRIYRW